MIRFSLIMTLVMIAGPALASSSCMTKGEARAKYRTSYLYWHGAAHCWDAGDRRAVRHAGRHRHRVAEPANHGRSVPVTVGDDRESKEAPPLKASSPEAGSPPFIWPEVPAEAALSYRWPDENEISPLRWLPELREYGKKE